MNQFFANTTYTGTPDMITAVNGTYVDQGSSTVNMVTTNYTTYDANGNPTAGTVTANGSTITGYQIDLTITDISMTINDANMISGWVNTFASCGTQASGVAFSPSATCLADLGISGGDMPAVGDTMYTLLGVHTDALLYSGASYPETADISVETMLDESSDLLDPVVIADDTGMTKL